MIDGEPDAALERCATTARALLWRPDVEVAGASVLSSGRLGPVLVVARGAPESVRVTPSTVFGPALAAGATALVFVHTHRTEFAVSAADLAVTRRLVAAGVVLGVPVIAHLVVGPQTWVDCLAGRGEPRGYSPGLDTAA